MADDKVCNSIVAGFAQEDSENLLKMHQCVEHDHMSVCQEMAKDYLHEGPKYRVCIDDKFMDLVEERRIDMSKIARRKIVELMGLTKGE